MLFQDTPAAFNWIVLAVVRRIVEQLNYFSGMVRKVNNTFKELCALTTAFWAIINLYLDMCDCWTIFRAGAFPPTHQAVYDEIAGLEGASECQI
jgi:hypothetical protein